MTDKEIAEIAARAAKEAANVAAARETVVDQTFAKMDALTESERDQFIESLSQEEFLKVRHKLGLRAKPKYRM